jgi:phosphoglucosamine mutase
MEKKYFGTDGIRGRVGKGVITPEFMLKLGWAAGKVLGNGHGGKILIGKDTRKSGYMFESALEAGLVAAGVDILLLGPMPTPAIAYLTRTFHAQAGIVISASHNPHFDNGIKFFGANGKKLPDETELAIEAMMDQAMVTVEPDKIGKAARVEDASGRYIEFCKSSVPFSTSLRGLKIVVDCAHGATYQTAPKVFRELGAQVVTIGNQPDGLNINAGVGSTSPALLQETVVKEKADLGVALDGDGDRVIMVDHEGNEIDGDSILYIIATSRQQSGSMQGAVVGTVMTNLGLEHALRDKGIALTRTSVGDRFIIEELEKQSWIIGGEPSGHIICLDRTTTGDGTISALQVVAEVAASGQSLKDLASQMNKYPQDLINIKLGNGNARELMSHDDINRAVREAEVELASNGRVLLRPSGTEPLMRVMVEGQDAEQVRRLAETIADAVRAAVS